MYYHRIIVNFRKTTSSSYFLHILVNIPQEGTDLAVYPKNFLGVYMIAYGIMGTASNIDPDKTYDYHTAFDIHPTEVVYNVDINANEKAIKNIKLDRNSDNSAATVGMVKELIPFTTNNIYRQYFENVYDFTDASKYRINTSASGVSFTGMDPGVTIIAKNIDKLENEGLRVDDYGVIITVPHSQDFTLCIVMKIWSNRLFSVFSIVSNTNTKTILFYDPNKKQLKLTTNSGTKIIYPSLLLTIKKLLSG